MNIKKFYEPPDEVMFKAKCQHNSSHPSPTSIISSNDSQQQKEKHYDFRIVSSDCVKNQESFQTSSSYGRSKPRLSSKYDCCDYETYNKEFFQYTVHQQKKKKSNTRAHNKGQTKMHKKNNKMNTQTHELLLPPQTYLLDDEETVKAGNSSYVSCNTNSSRKSHNSRSQSSSKNSSSSGKTATRKKFSRVSNTPTAYDKFCIEQRKLKKEEKKKKKKKKTMSSLMTLSILPSSLGVPNFIIKNTSI